MEEINQTNVLAPAERQIISKQVVENIRQAIFKGHLKQGEHIIEEQIAEAMEISRGPIREALVELEKEGLVERKTHRGTFVVNLTKDDAEEIHSLRLVLEQLAFEYAIKSAGPQDLIEMENIVNEIDNLIEENFNINKAIELDLKFHEFLVKSSKHKRLINYWMDLLSQTRIVLLSRVTSFPGIFNQEANSLHRDIIDAIRKKDLQYGTEILKKHLDKSFINLLFERM